MTRRDWYVAAVIVVVLLFLAYACIPRQASPPAPAPPAGTTPPATGTGTTR